MLEIPQTPSEILATNVTNQETQILQAGQPIYFIDRTEYPPEGGILVYKYGGELEPINFDPSKYEADGNRVLKELNELMNRNHFSLMGQDRKPAVIIPNDLVNLENNQKIVNRIDLKFPEKGYIDPLAVSLANQVKRFFKESIMFFSYKWTIISFLTFIFIPFRYKIKVVERWLDGWAGFGIVTTDPRRMKPHYYTEFCRELYKFTNLFLNNLGISKEVSEKTAWIAAEIIERDDAYRFRFQDLAGVTNADLITKNPRKEIKKIVATLRDREKTSPKLIKSLNSAARIATVITYSKRVRKAFNKALKEITFKNFQMDAIDNHQTLRMKGYEFGGKPYEDRIKEYNDLYDGHPPNIGHITAI